MAASQHGSRPTVGLIAGCRRGDERAWRELLAEVRKLALDLARWKYRLALDEAEDMAQVVQIRVAERLGQLRDAEAFPYWVRRLAHHAAIDQMRQRRSHVSLDDLLNPDHSPNAEPQSDAGYDEILLRADIAEAVDHLPERYREPIRLHFLKGLPQDEVGELLGRPRSTVASQIERGLHRLQRSLHSFAN